MELHDYQKQAVDRVLSQPRLALFMEMGMGKTLITLTALDRLLTEGAIKKVLLICPKKVINTWQGEIKKWGFPCICPVVYDPNKMPELRELVSEWKRTDIDPYTKQGAEYRERLRKRAKAIHDALPGNVIITNPEKITASFATIMMLSYDQLVIDESTLIKNPQSKIFKILKISLLQHRAKQKVVSDVPTHPRVLLLTGTPAPNGIQDLWSQIYLLDLGQAIGQTYSKFKYQYASVAHHNGPEWMHKTTFTPEQTDRILASVAHLTHTVKSNVIHAMQLIQRDVIGTLSSELMTRYRQLRDDGLLTLDKEDDKLFVKNAIAICSKLMQFSSGAIYDADGVANHVHNEKLDLLRKALQTTQGNVLVAYNFRHERDAIQSAFPEARVLETNEDIEDWNAGKVSLLLANPQSSGFGLNLQYGGHTLIWFSGTWRLDLYQQMNARLFRQGQSHDVTIIHLILAPIDTRLFKAIATKNTEQSDLVNTLSSALELTC